MVRIEDFKVEEHLDDFYRDGARFKNMKLLIDFNQVNLKVETPSLIRANQSSKRNKQSTYTLNLKATTNLYFKDE